MIKELIEIDKKCIGCYGTGMQYSHIDGLRHTCPICKGTGGYKRKRGLRFQ